MARLIGERDGYVEGLEKVQVIFEDGSSKKVDKQMAFCKLSECGKNIKENTAMGANCNCNQPKLVHAQCIKIFRQKDGYNYCSKCEKTLDYAPVQLVAEQMSTEKKKSTCWTFFKMPTCISAPASPNANHSMQLNSKQGCCSLPTHTPGRANFSPKPVMAALTSVPAAGLSETFIRLRKQGKVALLPYVMAGDPNLSTTAEALKILDSCGSDIIELGVPYSDPLADGPVIQAAATRSLQGGTNFDKIISMLKDVTPQLSCPIALFTYYNPILKRGVEKFMDTLKDAGVQGLVVPDVPLEETEILRKEASKKKIELVLLTTPTTPTARMKSIVESSEGFVYLGVTGARESASHNGQFLLKQIKEATSKPVAVGFGISKPEHVKQVAAWGADGVIVGSAMARILGEAKSPEEGLKELQIFATSLKSAL